MHACATSARARRADLRRRYWATSRAAVTTTSTAALATTAPAGLRHIARSNDQAEQDDQDRAESPMIVAARVPPSRRASVTDAGARGASRLLRPRAAGRGTASNAASTAQPRLAMIMINVRASVPAGGYPDPTQCRRPGGTGRRTRCGPARFLGSRTKIEISATRRIPESSRATWMTASSAEASCACNAARGSPPSEARASRRAGISAVEFAWTVPQPPSWPVFIAVSRSTDLGPAYLAHHEPVGGIRDKECKMPHPEGAGHSP